VKHRQEESGHLEVVRQLVALPREESKARASHKRGFERQRSRRELEAVVRERAGRLGMHLTRKERSFEALARRLGLGRTTLSTWTSDHRRNVLRARPRGRPVCPLGVKVTGEIKDTLEVHGPGIGVPTLKALFPGVPRRELVSQLWTYRKEWRTVNRKTIRALRFMKPGRVWAMDFWAPDMPIEGPFTQVLAVRDLASRNTLMSLPLERATGRAVFNGLRALFAKYGPPLVIKIDNATAFEVPELEGLLKGTGVIYLKSPPYTPWYNGAVECGNGTQKYLTHHEAAHHDHPEYWTLDDIEAARRRANRYAKPYGLDWPDADEIFERRERITAEERAVFQATAREQWGKILTEEEAERKKQGGPALDKEDLARIRRSAIQSALLETGNLEVRRRRVSPPYTRRVPS